MPLLFSLNPLVIVEHAMFLFANPNPTEDKYKHLHPPYCFFWGGGKPIHTNIRLLTLKDGEAEVMDAAIDVTSKAQHHAGLLVLSIRILHRDDGVLCAEIPLAELYAGVHFAVPVPIV